MALKCVFQFESLDSTRSLNQRAEHLFKKGIYYGGKVSTNSEQVTSQIVTISPFRLISSDGMYVISDTDIFLSVGVGSFYIVCKAKYVVDDSPDISVLAITQESYSHLTDEEKKEYIIFASATSSGDGVQITQTTVKEEISQLGRNPWRGYFESEDSLSQLESVVGDIAMVKSTSSIGVELYVFNGSSWVNYGSANEIYEKLVMHQNNQDKEIPHTKPIYDTESSESITEQEKWKGSYHINWNQLNALEKFENNLNSGSEPVVTETKSVNLIGIIQSIYLKYGKTKTINVPNFTSVENISSLDSSGKYYYDNTNGIIYIWGNNNTSVNITYTYSYDRKHIVAENEFFRITRQNELDALVGNSHTGDRKNVNKVPSSNNRFVTENTPIPKKMTETGVRSGTEYIIIPSGLVLYIGTDGNAKEFFNIEQLENDKPIFFDKVVIVNNGTPSSNEPTSSDTKDGWFYTTTSKTLAIKISAINEFTAQTLSSSSYNFSYYGMDGIGNTNIEPFALKNYEKTFIRSKFIKTDNIFGVYLSSIVDREFSLTPSNLTLKSSILTIPNKSVLKSDELEFYYNNTKTGSIKSNGTTSITLNGDVDTYVTASNGKQAYLYGANGTNVGTSGGSVTLGNNSNSTTIKGNNLSLNSNGEGNTTIGKTGKSAYIEGTNIYIGEDTSSNNSVTIGNIQNTTTTIRGTTVKTHSSGLTSLNDSSSDGNVRVGNSYHDVNIVGNNVTSTAGTKFEVVSGASSNGGTFGISGSGFYVTTKKETHTISNFTVDGRNSSSTISLYATNNILIDAGNSTVEISGNVDIGDTTHRTSLIGGYSEISLEDKSIDISCDGKTGDASTSILSSTTTSSAKAAINLKSSYNSSNYGQISCQYDNGSSRSFISSLVSNNSSSITVGANYSSKTYVSLYTNSSNKEAYIDLTSTCTLSSNLEKPANIVLKSVQNNSRYGVALLSQSNNSQSPSNGIILANYGTSPSTDLSNYNSAIIVSTDTLIKASTISLDATATTNSSVSVNSESITLSNNSTSYIRIRHLQSNSSTDQEIVLNASSSSSSTSDYGVISVKPHEILLDAHAQASGSCYISIDRDSSIAIRKGSVSTSSYTNMTFESNKFTVANSAGTNNANTITLDDNNFTLTVKNPYQTGSATCVLSVKGTASISSHSSMSSYYTTEALTLTVSGTKYYIVLEPA